MKRTFSEELGDVLSSWWKRFFVGLAIAIFGIFILIIPILGLVGLLICPLGLLLAVSLATRSKAKFIRSIKISDSEGRSVTCGLIEVRDYAVTVLLFLSPLYYIPFRKRYYLVKNIGDAKINRGVKIEREILMYPILDVERIYSIRYKQLLYTRNTVTDDELVKTVFENRENTLKGFFEYEAEGKIEKFLENDSVVMYKIADDCYILYNCCNKQNKLGMIFSKREAENLAQNPDGWFAILLSMSPVLVKSKLKAFDDFFNIINETPEKNEADETPKPSIDKKLLTKDGISNLLIARYCGQGRVVGGVFLFIIAWGFLLVGVGSLLTLLIPAALIFLPLAVLFVYLGIKACKSPKVNKTKIQEGKYRLIKKTCTWKRIDDTDETTDYILHFNDEMISVSSNVYNYVKIGKKYYLLFFENNRFTELYNADYFELDEALESILEK